MISKEKSQLLYEYDKPIIWNLSCFGNIPQMIILDNMIDILDMYNIKCPIYTIHGSYSSKYNGGRTALFHDSWTNIENMIHKYNKKGIGIKMTFSNMNVHKEQFEEKEMRWYLDILNETKGIGNGIICVNDDFAKLVKKNYPDLDLVASHVKMELETKMGITDTVDYYNSKFDLYDIVVMNTFRAFDDDFLSKIKHPEKVEFIVNHSCTTNCQMAKRHHELIDAQQELKVALNHDKKRIDKNPEFIHNKQEIQKILERCQKIKYENNFNKLCTQFINRHEINHLANTFNITRFKIEGRDLSTFEFVVSLTRSITNIESFYDIIHTKESLKMDNPEFRQIITSKFLD